ncbi:putative fluoride ion transporter CrcB [Campylobacterota bacterium]|nr:putative fluoride ion transporter CrcB [Campylobacterota bacterium]
MGVIYIAFGGALGAVSRYMISIAALRIFGDSFAFGTLIVNTLGTFLATLFLTIACIKTASFFEGAHLFFVVGFLGALTTFSTFGAETIAMWQNSLYLKAAANILLNNTLAIAAGFAGFFLGKSIC